jgi:glycosyltransferase involved in cell wall biosynthesis
VKPTNKKLRILFSSNAPWSPSGYSQQIRQFAPLVREAGYPTAISCFYGLEGGVIELDGILMYPKIADPWGSDAMLSHSKHFKADVVISLQDTWVLNMGILKELSSLGKRWIPIAPIDHEPVPSAVLERLRLAYRIVSMSPFGYKELRRVGLHSTYIPHTVETEYFCKYDKKEAKKKLGIPEDMFIFGMVAANKDNPPRKGFQHVLDAFKIFHEKHPNSGIYFHVMTSQQGGFQIDEYAKNLGIEKAIYRVDPYRLLYDINPEEMAHNYSAFDCLLAPSTGEGFGIPIIEAQSCEVPVITSDFTAMKDLVIDGKTGYLVHKGFKRFDGLGSYSFEVDNDELLERMEQVYNADRDKMGKEARRFILDNFDLKLVWERNWAPFLKLLESEIYDKQS